MLFVVGWEEFTTAAENCVEAQSLKAFEEGFKKERRALMKRNAELASAPANSTGGVRNAPAKKTNSAGGGRQAPAKKANHPWGKQNMPNNKPAVRNFCFGLIFIFLKNFFLGGRVFNRGMCCVSVCVFK